MQCGFRLLSASRFNMQGFHGMRQFSRGRLYTAFQPLLLREQYSLGLFLDRDVLHGNQYLSLIITLHRPGVNSQGPPTDSGVLFELKIDNGSLFDGEALECAANGWQVPGAAANLIQQAIIDIDGFEAVR